MSNVCVYSFADATGLTKYVDSQGDFLFTGTWSSGGTYTATPLMAAQYGAAYYMCIRDNVGDNPQRTPTRTRPQSWSIMSLLYEYQCGPGTLTPAEALAEAAWELAQTGTNIAWSAYYLAQIGTNTGSAAYDLAGSAYGLAGSAFYLAGDAYSYANAAFTIAVDGTNLAQTALSVADDAYRLAQIGTNTGTAALNAAAAAQNTANGAFFIAVAGTNAAASAQSVGDAAYRLAQIGTNTGTAALNAAATAQSVADAAYALAELGTLIPPLSTLPDVSIPAPTANQVLTYSGSVWIASDTPAQVAPGAYTLYLENSPSGTAGYDLLLSNPSGLPEDFDAVSVGGGTPFVPTDAYISNQVNRTVLNGGIWEFNTYASVSNGANSAQLVVELYTRSIAGVETFLFNGTTSPISSTTPVLSALITTQGSYVTALTDKLVAKYFWLRTSSPAVTATIYHSGSIHASHIHTPVGYSHNDLSGLQGGTTDQFYHVTFDEDQALTGNLGYPSASNPYVTLAGLNYADGTLTTLIQTAQATGDAAYALAQIGTNTGTAAYNLADAAYALAQIGTNTGTAAYQLAQSGSNYAAAAYSMAQIGTAIPNYYYGGTMYGSLVVPSVVVGVGSTATSGTVYYNFNGPAYQTTAVSGGPLILNGTNFRAGAEIAVVLISNGVTQPLYFGNPLSAATTWVGTTAPVQIYDKDIVIAMTCISDAPVAVYACQATEP